MMADEIDLANEQAERFLQASIQAHQNSLNQAGNDWPYGIGRCKNCGEVIDDGRPYCSEDCRDDHWVRIKSDMRNRKYRG